jgi:hypothetical protein
VASKQETAYCTGLHKHFPPRTELYREKMSNPWRGGTFDYWYSGYKRDLWVEYKFLPKLPLRAALVPALSALQLEWGQGRRAEGRDVVVVVGTRNGFGVLLEDPSSWVNGAASDAVQHRLFKNRELAAIIASHCNAGVSICSTPYLRSSAGPS